MKKALNSVKDILEEGKVFTCFAREDSKDGDLDADLGPTNLGGTKLVAILKVMETETHVHHRGCPALRKLSHHRINVMTMTILMVIC